MRLDDLKILECFLQNTLHAHLARIVPFQIHCAYKNDTLLVLAQHPVDEAIDIPDTFRVLKQTLQSEEPKTPLAVKLYLRTEGNRRPYSQQSFSVYPHISKVLPGEAAPQIAENSGGRVSLESDLNRLVAMKSIAVVKTPSESIVQPQVEILGEFVSTAQLLELPAKNAPNQIEVLEPIASSEIFSADIASSLTIEPSAVPTPPAPPVAPPQRQLLRPMIIGGLGAIAVGSGLGYMGTRPCVFGVCTELNSSRQVAESALAIANNPRSTGNDILIAQQQLHKSVTTLESVPIWSGSYNSAQQSIRTTKPAIADLDTTVLAMNEAWGATNLIKTTPVTMDKWQESRQMWTDAISNLTKVSPTSKVFPLAQQKLTDYQGKLGEVEHRIGAETAADTALRTAAIDAQSATQAQSTAKTLTEWQGVKTTWDRVKQKLMSIPSTSIVYPQAQEILKATQTQILTATEKFQEETKATQNYDLAVKSATEAKLAEKNNRLAGAVDRWNQAAIAIQSIPQTSTVFDRAKPLVLEYTKSFQRAEEQLKNTERIAIANRDLQRTCAGNPQICTYTVTAKGIAVHFTPLYSNTVMQTAKTAWVRDNTTVKLGILNHVNTLGDALQVISENAKLPIDIYAANGKKIRNYKPKI
jgi:hypothetical protein